MGDHMIKIQKSTLASPGDVSVNQRQASELGATDRSSPIGRNAPIPTGLRKLPRGTKPPHAAAGYQRTRLTMLSQNLLDSTAKADAAKAAAKAAIAAEAAAGNKMNSLPVLPQVQNRISLTVLSQNLLDSTNKADAAKAAAKAAIAAEAAAGNKAIGK
jgi:hypothetical protein